MTNEIVAILKAENKDLKEQLHAYEQYFKCLDEWQMACSWDRDKERKAFEKANVELQTLRNQKRN